MIKIGKGLAPEFKAACDGGGSCVEVAFLHLVAVRDSKDPDGPALIFTVDEWVDFTEGVKLGEFDF
jgi:Domain of unknown function (DUF397)